MISFLAGLLIGAGLVYLLGRWRPWQEPPDKTLADRHRNPPKTTGRA